jgi:hypothetical protein
MMMKAQKDLNFEKIPKNQKENRRLAVFRLGSLTGSLLTLDILYTNPKNLSLPKKKIYNPIQSLNK